MHEPTSDRYKQIQSYVDSIVVALYDDELSTFNRIINDRGSHDDEWLITLINDCIDTERGERE